MINEYDSTALLAIPKVKEGSSPERGLLVSSRPFMVEEIRKLGVDVAFSRGVAAFDTENNEIKNAYSPEYSETNGIVTAAMHDLGRFSLNSFGVIRSVIHTVDPINSNAKFLNPNIVRRLSSNKIISADHILVPAGVYGRDYIEFDADNHNDNIDDYLAEIQGDEVVAKPISGARSEGIIVGNKSEVAEALKAATGRYIIEEKIIFDAPLPSLRGINSDETTRLKMANDSLVNRELRMYYFGNNTWDSVVRIGATGEKSLSHDNWLYIDLDSIPGDLIKRSADVVSKMQGLVGAREQEFHIAVDWVYGSTEKNRDPSWKVMEINAGEPQLVQISENEEIGKRHHRKLAAQIARVALS